MLQILNIIKEYKTGDLIQRALDGVSLNLRDSEFVAILGPSGSGKTTLLNVLGGLDQYDRGNLIINGVSTKRYKDKDWDSYRNHSIGFVFQSYNLIPHQTVLSNVELALTISGVSKEKRRKMAKEALEKVGLGDHIHKLPNQLSGGQMQRVAIARALVNDPDILLADEPTGALDSETSVQIMELLKEVAQEKLVVMVTHNPELAQEYATRIVNLKDGKITGDSDPYEVEGNGRKAQHRNLGKTFMSFWTALSLSFNNLRTKVGRTFLTAFAGSIGIIGIAMILSLSTGVNNYITDIQRETMASYPVTIQAQALDLSSILTSGGVEGEDRDIGHDLDAVYSNPVGIENASTITSSVSENDLTNFKQYLDNPNSEIRQYIGENGIVYSYATQFDLYSHDPGGVLVNTDGTSFDQEETDEETQNMGRMMISSTPGSMGTANRNMSIMSGESNNNNTDEMIPGQNGALISNAITEQYDLLAGNWPTQANEIMLVLDHNNEIAAASLYELGLLPSEDYEKILQDLDDGNEIVLDVDRWDYDEIIGKEYTVVPESEYYVENEEGYFDYKKNDDDFVNGLLADDSKTMKLKIAGIIRAGDEDASQLIVEPIGYTQELTNWIIEKTDESPVVQAQKNSPDVNVLNGMTFEPEDDLAKIDDAITFLSELSTSDKASMMRGMLQSMGQGDMAEGMDEQSLATYMDTFLLDPDDDAMLNIYDTYISSGSYDDNLSAFGVVSLDAPSAINIYTDSFENKDKIGESIDNYNKMVSDEEQITYTDIVGLLMSSVTTIINVITWVLVAFVAVALVVSSIMIGIITYISVLERTKEIGILRSIGASKGNISQVFNAETFIIGLISGVLGIAITLLLLIPTNIIIHHLMGTNSVNAQLPFWSGLVLVVLSVILTLIGGFIPAKKAAKQDPVKALRNE